MTTDIPRLDTARLRLRANQAADLAPFLAMWQEPAFYEFLTGAPLGEEEVWTKLLRHLGQWPMQGYGYWGIEEKATGELVGAVGFADWQRTIEPSLKGFPEMGWVLAPRCHGRGYAAEAAQAALAWADAQLAQRRTVCLIDEANAPSLRLAAKLGFQEFSRTIYKGQSVRLLERLCPTALAV